VIALVGVGVVLLALGLAVLLNVAGFAGALSRYSVEQRERRGWRAGGTPISLTQARIRGAGAAVIGVLFIAAGLGFIHR